MVLLGRVEVFRRFDDIVGCLRSLTALGEHLRGRKGDDLFPYPSLVPTSVSPPS